MKNLRSMILCGVLALVMCLTGCQERGASGGPAGGNDSSADGSSIVEGAGFKTVEELQAASEEVMKDITSFAASGSLDVGIKISSGSDQAAQMDIPIAVTYTVRASDQDKMFGDLRLKVDFPDEFEYDDVDEKLTFYTQITDSLIEVWFNYGGEWVYQSSPRSDDDPVADFDIDDAGIEKYKGLDIGLGGELSKSGDDYVITQSFEPILASEMLTAVFGDIDAFIDEMSSNVDDGYAYPDGDFSAAGASVDSASEMISVLRDLFGNVKQQLGKGKIIASYDKDGYLKNVKITDVNISFDIPAGEAQTVDVSLILWSATSFSDYNAVADKDVSVPDDVKNAAVSIDIFPSPGGDADIVDFGYSGNGAFSDIG